MMKLMDLSVKERKQLARELGVSMRMISQWARGEDNMSITKAILIERKTEGKVKRFEAAFPEIDF